MQSDPGLHPYVRSTFSNDKAFDRQREKNVPFVFVEK